MAEKMSALFIVGVLGIWNGVEDTNMCRQHIHMQVVQQSVTHIIANQNSHKAQGVISASLQSTRRKDMARHCVWQIRHLMEMAGGKNS